MSRSNSLFFYTYSKLTWYTSQILFVNTF
ncbi:hypothetical protein ACFW04_011929 [Cataglyphis niger]